MKRKYTNTSYLNLKLQGYASLSDIGNKKKRRIINDSEAFLFE